MSLFLTRNGALRDFKTQNSVKIFGNIVSGKLLPLDKILLCTPGLFEVFSRQNTFQDLAYFTHEQQFQELFKSKEKELSKTPGLLFGVLIEEIPLKKITRPSLKARFPELSLPQLKLPALPRLNLYNVKLGRGLTSTPQMKRRILFILLFIGMLFLGSLLF